MSEPAAAGAPQGSMTTPEGLRRSARIAAREAAKAEFMREPNAVDNDLAYNLADALLAANEITGTAGTGGKKRTLRGGSETVNAIKSLTKGLLGNVKGVVTALDRALGNVISIGIPTVAFVGTSVAVLNHPTILGNLSQLVALALTKGTETSITSTWGQWGQAVAAVGTALKTLGGSIVVQSLQGPVIPVAIAIAILIWRAKKSGTTLTDVLKGDATFVSSKVAGVIASQIQAFNDAKESGDKEEVIRQLRELASRAKVPTFGDGALVTTVLATQGGAPAAEPSKLEETVSLVRGTPKRDYKIALKPLTKGGPLRVVGVQKPVETPEAAATAVDTMDEEDALSLLAAVALMEEAATGGQGVELSPIVAPPPTPSAASTAAASPRGYPTRSSSGPAFGVSGVSPSSSTYRGRQLGMTSTRRESSRSRQGREWGELPGEEERREEEKDKDKDKEVPAASSSSSSSTTPGGRRNKTRKTKKSKRRMTRRKPRVQIVKFAY